MKNNYPVPAILNSGDVPGANPVFRRRWHPILIPRVTILSSNSITLVPTVFGWLNKSVHLGLPTIITQFFSKTVAVPLQLYRGTTGKPIFRRRWQPKLVLRTYPTSPPKTVKLLVSGSFRVSGNAQTESFVYSYPAKAFTFLGRNISFVFNNVLTGVTRAWNGVAPNQASVPAFSTKSFAWSKVAPTLTAINVLTTKAWNWLGRNISANVPNILTAKSWAWTTAISVQRYNALTAKSYTFTGVAGQPSLFLSPAKAIFQYARFGFLPFGSNVTALAAAAFGFAGRAAGLLGTFPAFIMKILYVPRIFNAGGVPTRAVPLLRRKWHPRRAARIIISTPFVSGSNTLRFPKVAVSVASGSFVQTFSNVLTKTNLTYVPRNIVFVFANLLSSRSVTVITRGVTFTFRNVLTVKNFTWVGNTAFSGGISLSRAVVSAVGRSFFMNRTVTFVKNNLVFVGNVMFPSGGLPLTAKTISVLGKTFTESKRILFNAQLFTFTGQNVISASKSAYLALLFISSIAGFWLVKILVGLSMALLP